MVFGKMFVLVQMTQKGLGPQRMRNSGKMTLGHVEERARGLSSAGRQRGEKVARAPLQSWRKKWGSRSGPERPSPKLSTWSGFPAFCPAPGLAQTPEREAAQRSDPVPEAHLEVAHCGLQTPALGLGDALETAEHEARVALAALHAAVLTGHAQEAGKAGGGAPRGAQTVPAVGWAGQSWGREKQT